jgi:hypothetical protein
VRAQAGVGCSARHVQSVHIEDRQEVVPFFLSSRGSVRFGSNRGDFPRSPKQTKNSPKSWKLPGLATANTNDRRIKHAVADGTTATVPMVDAREREERKGTSAPPCTQAWEKVGLERRSRESLACLVHHTEGNLVLCVDPPSFQRVNVRLVISKRAENAR